MQNLLRQGLVFAIAALLGSATLLAQVSSVGVLITKNPNRWITSEPAPAPSACPIVMHAQQRAGGDTLVAKDRLGGRTRVPASHIHLTLSKANGAPAVAGARVTVYGTGGRSRMVPLVSGADGSADTKKSLDLELGHPDNEGVAAELFLAGFTSVQSIRLDSLEFSDGTVWTPTGGQVCRVAPDLMMLVSGR